MLLPQGNVLHKELNTSFIDFRNFLVELRQNRFCGYIRLNYWQFEAIMICDTGRIKQAYSTEKDEFVLGTNALMNMIERSREKDGTIDTHVLESESALVISEVLGADMQKSIRFRADDGLQNLMQSLDSESFTGYLDIQFESKKGFATIFLLEGSPVESVLMSNSGKILSGDTVYTKILDLSKLIGLNIKMFQNLNIETIDENKLFVFPESDHPHLIFWTDIFNYFKEFVENSLRNAEFSVIWSETCLRESSNVKILKPELKNLIYDGTTLRINGVFWKEILEAEMEYVLHLVFLSLPWKRRFRLNAGKMLAEFKVKYPIDYSYISEQKIETLFNGIFGKQ